MEFSSSTNPITITSKEFNAFHNIDRKLYKRLIVNLAIDPLKSIQVIGLWLWFERTGYETRLIYNLSTVADHIISTFANEALLVLHCLETNEFTFSMETKNDLPLTTIFIKNIFTLRYFFDNRSSIRSHVEKLVNGVCWKALRDIYEQFLQKSVGAQGNRGIHSPIVSPIYQDVQFGEANELVPQNYGHFNGGDVENLYAFHSTTNNLGIQQAPQLTNNMYFHMMNNDMGDSSSHWNPNTFGTDETWSNSAPDNRTIFLTFSKGYPIPEREVREFFTQKFRGCIEAIYMQEVSSDEQPLYAKLMVYSPSQIDIVLRKKDKVKFTINGKHVWARKFVSKSVWVPSSSQPNSAAIVTENAVASLLE